MGRGQNHQAYLWQYGRPGGGVVFDFRLGRGREGPKEFLGQFEGILQTDGYVAYDGVGGPKMVHAGCWAHARRKFFDAAKLNPSDAVATRIVGRIDELFGIDAVAREQKLDYAARHVLRLERAKPLVETIHGEVEAARDASLPSERVGEGGELHALAVAEAHALSGVPRVGTEQQPGGELDAPGSAAGGAYTHGLGGAEPAAPHRRRCQSWCCSDAYTRTHRPSMYGFLPYPQSQLLGCLVEFIPLDTIPGPPQQARHISLLQNLCSFRLQRSSLARGPRALSPANRRAVQIPARSQKDNMTYQKCFKTGNCTILQSSATVPTESKRLDRSFLRKVATFRRKIRFLGKSRP